MKDNKVIEEISCDDKGLGYLEGFKGEFEDFYQGICQDKNVDSSFKEGYADFKVISEALALAGI